MDKERIEKCIEDIKSKLNAIIQEINEPHAKVYSKDDLLRYFDDESDAAYMLACIYVQEIDTCEIYASVLDIWNGVFGVVSGIQLFHPLSDYGVTWIAWDDIPTQEQIDAIRWPKCTKNQSLAKSNYLFGEEKQHG